MSESQISTKIAENLGKQGQNRNTFNLHLLANLLTSYMREIQFYKTAADQSPIIDFIDALSSKEAQKVLWTFKVVEELDTVPAQYLKKLKSTDDIWEIRVISSGNAYRFLGFFHGNELIILTNAFAKKTQKTPRKEIELAEQRKREYLNKQEEK